VLIVVLGVVVDALMPLLDPRLRRDSRSDEFRRTAWSQPMSPNSRRPS
jgi:hypothetical protein